MTFDDRLSTVLAGVPTDAHERAVRWRQLVDLVSRGGPDASGPAVCRAIDTILGDRDKVAVPQRAAAARAIAGRELPRALLEAFAGDTVEVAAPLLTGASDQALREAASPEVRRFLDAIHAGEGRTAFASLGESLGSEQPGPASDAAPLLSEAVPTIDEVVARIEQLRLSREVAAEPAERREHPLEADAEVVPEPSPEPHIAPERAPTTERVSPDFHRPPPAPAEQSRIGEGSPALFRWECGPGGDIGWVEGVSRGPVIGRSIARASRQDGVDQAVERAFARRLPFHEAALEMSDAGAAGGQWLISGVPAFAPDDGRFVGYRGVARRPSAHPRGTDAGDAPGLDTTALRELVHEIRTPLNAIIGFAEIIDGQYLGPAQSSYRERAADIVAQARVLLAAVEDLDFAARLRAGGGDPAHPAFATFVPPLVEQLRVEAAASDVVLAIDSPTPEGSCAVPAALAERLIERFVASVLALAGQGETLRLAVRDTAAGCVLRLSVPRALESMPVDELLAGARNGLSLRLVTGLAQIVGARVDAERGEMLLTLPAA